MIYKERDRAARKAPARYVKRLIKQGVPLIVIGKYKGFGHKHQFYNFKAVISGFQNKNTTHRRAKTKTIQGGVMVYEER